MSERDPDDPAGGSWHLDKRVPLALIITIGLQTGAMIWWASSLSERVNTLERQATVAAPWADRLTRVEVRMEAIAEGITRIERSVTARSAP